MHMMDIRGELRIKNEATLFNGVGFKLTRVT